MATVIKDSGSVHPQEPTQKVVGTCKPHPVPPLPLTSLRDMLRSQMKCCKKTIQPFGVAVVDIAQPDIYIYFIATSDTLEPMTCNKVLPTGVNGITSITVANPTAESREYELSWI